MNRPTVASTFFQGPIAFNNINVELSTIGAINTGNVRTIDVAIEQRCGKWQGYHTGRSIHRRDGQSPQKTPEDHADGVRIRLPKADLIFPG